MQKTCLTFFDKFKINGYNMKIADVIDSKNDVCGIVAAFNFDDNAMNNALLIARLVEHLIIIDDGSKDKSKLNQLNEMGLHNVEVILSPDNLGIANSLNVGAKLALDLGYEWCITFDQDSTPDKQMVKLLQKQQKALSELYGDKVAIVAPNIVDQNANTKNCKYLVENKKFTFVRKSPDVISNDDKILVVITSGTLTNLNILHDLGFFKTDLFIDYVDTEYCMRLIVNDYKIGVAKDALLTHNLGQKERKKFVVWSLCPPIILLSEDIISQEIQYICIEITL
ncbi:hypothetical protein GCM10025855_09350 [Shewanella glacialipiscicola]|uniref:Glycosyltransferase 2-like domain-containing protein n=2 Tax=Shewanella glacialipiscicola TaxID=614069 RepID=A0ABQ6IZY0_9GAMM|nr:hypothetical protein GCM10025855_09350 [Shewanella glacialipiscicola]